jgi:hypothetical protein
MLLRHPISRRGFLLGTSVAASYGLPATAGLPGLVQPEETASFVVQSFAEIAGARLDFDRDVEVYKFISADPDQWDIYIRCPDGVQVIRDFPEVQQVSNRWAYGIMENPAFDNEQGFDERYHDFSHSSQVIYNPTLNVAPSKPNGQPYIVTPASSETGVTLVKHFRRGGTPTYQVPEKYVSFHFGRDPLPRDAIPPSLSAPVKRIFTLGDINWSALRSLNMSGLDVLSASAALAEVDPNIGVWGQDFQALRHWRMGDQHATGYSAGIVSHHSRALMSLHSDDLTQEQKLPIVLRTIRHGLQVLGVADQRGSAGVRGGAGQGGSIGMWAYYAAALLGDSDLWHQAKTTGFQFDQGTPTWSRPSLIGTPSAPHNVGNAWRFGQTVFDEGPHNFPSSQPNRFDSLDFNSGYGAIAMRIVAWEGLAVAILQNAPGGETGIEGILNGATPLNQNHQRAAVPALWTRIYNATPQPVHANPVGNDWRAFYDALWPLLGLPEWENVPDQLYSIIPNSGEPYDVVSWTGGDGSISWSLPSNVLHTTRPVTRHDVRYSLDGLEWIEVSDVDRTGTETGLLKGVEHLAGMRRWNEHGASLWSPNFPILSGGANRSVHHVNDRSFFRGRVTTTGTDTDASVSYAGRVQPRIFERRYPRWNFKWFEPAGQDLRLESGLLACGVGYPSGFPGPTFTYQWLRDGAEIAGATGKEYDITGSADNLGVNISCRVTASNGVGSPAIVETASVHVPAQTALPEGVHFDSDFGALSSLYDQEVWASRWGDAVHESTFEPSSNVVADPWFGGDDAPSPSGAIANTATGNGPQFAIDLAARKPLLPGKTYVLEIDLPMQGFNANLELYVGSGSRGAWNSPTDNYVPKQV